MDKLTLKADGLEIIVDIDPKDLMKFADDTLAAFDVILHRVISIHKFGIEYAETDEDQKVVIDNIIEGLK